MLKIRKIKVLSLAKFQAILLSLIGCIAGVIYSIGGLIYDTFTVGLSFGTALAFFALMGMPLLFAVVGFIVGLLQGWLFNLFGRWFGGIVINLEMEPHP